MGRTSSFTRVLPGDGEEEDEGITELEKFMPERIDAVQTPASGFGILLLKSVAPSAPGGSPMTKPANDAPGGAGMETGIQDPVAKDDGDRDGDGENALPSDKDTGPDDGDGAAEKTTADGGTADPSDAETAEDGAQAAKEALDPDGMDAVKNASPADRDAYLSALRDHRGAEPLGKGAATGTEYLQAKAQWRDWSAFGEREGLDGTAEGARCWLTKHGTGPVPPAAAPEPAPVEEPVVASPEVAEAMLKAIMEAEAPVYKRDIDTETRHRLAAEHKALPDGSYPIENKEDLGNAAILARSGHGNVSGAKALIRRRADELGVANPLDDGNRTTKADSDSDADADDAPKGRKCPACKGSGKIRGGNMTCPKCKGKGVLPAKASKTAGAAVNAVKATLEAGLISREAADGLIAQITEQAAGQVIGQVTEQAVAAVAAKAAGPGARPLPPQVMPAGPHREPDGTSTVEQLESDAGMGTDSDTSADHVPASVAALTMKAPYEVDRMHDALCAAYPADAVLAAYPAMKSIADAVDVGWFTQEATSLLGKGEPAKAAILANLAATAQAVKGYSGAAIDDARALLHKSFADMYPNEKIKPQMGVRPGSYQRPYLSAGHAAPNSGSWTVNVPPSTHTPEPQDYQRGSLTAGHAAPSPADHGPNNPSPPDSGGREYYSTSEKDMAGAAMRSMHDHIAATFAGTCPMAPSRTVMPPGMGATNTPSTTMPHATGGVATVGKEAGDAMGGTPVTTGLREIRGNRGMGRKKLRKALEAALRAAGTQMMGPAEIEALIAAKMAPIATRYDSEAAEMRKQIDELGKQPDPAMAPVRGQMARAGSGNAAPVEKRSLIDEAATRQMRADAERRQLLEYVAKQASSPDPNTRERAQAYLDELTGGARVPA